MIEKEEKFEWVGEERKVRKERKEITRKEKESQNRKREKKMRERMEFRWDRVDSMDLYINEQGREGVRKNESEREREIVVKKKWTNCACLHGNEWNLISSSSGKWMERTKSRRGKKENKEKWGRAKTGTDDCLVVSFFSLSLTVLSSSSFFLPWNPLSLA